MTIAEVTIRNFPATGALVLEYDPTPADANTVPPTRAIPGFDNPALIGGPMFNVAGTPTAIFMVLPAAAGADAEGNLPLNVSLSSGAVTAINAVPPTLTLANSYSFRVRAIIDRDTSADGSDTDPTDFPAGHTAINNDHDSTLTGNVVVNVMRVSENDLQFDVDQSKAVKGATVSGLRRPIGSNPLQWDVTGIGSSAKLVSIATTTGELEDFEIKESPVGSGNFRLFVTDSGVDSLTNSGEQCSGPRRRGNFNRTDIRPRHGCR